MISLITTSKAQEKLAENLRKKRVSMGLTQAGLAKRSGVKLPSLRKFEQKSLISLESFLKLSMTLGALDKIVTATEKEPTTFTSFKEALQAESGLQSTSNQDSRQKGWIT